MFKLFQYSFFQIDSFSRQVCVLNNFNLTVREGEVVALVGSSGGGKSSIMKLIKRVYEPISGSILLDGKPLSSYDNWWLQSNIAAVTQEPVLHDCRSHPRRLPFSCST
jgi:ABC-type multidrug transport system fused ATPase/permease subunit